MNGIITGLMLLAAATAALTIQRPLTPGSNALYPAAMVHNDQLDTHPRFDIWRRGVEPRVARTFEVR